MVVCHIDDGAHLYAGLPHIGEQEADAAMLGGVGIRARQHHHMVGVVGVGRPYLCAVDHEIVAVFNRAGLQGR